MDQLVDLIVQKILQRQTAVLQVDCSQFDEKAHSVSDFTNHQQIQLQNVGAIQLAKLAKLDANDAFTSWLLKGLELECEFSLQLAFAAVCLVPKELFTWPITLKTKQGKKLQTFFQKVITYQDVALLTNEDALVLFRQQKMTALAQEELAKKKIQQIERF
ncbi:microcompartment protein PduM [Enterococcus sp. PF1-24]|uniref:PduM family microcompartment protein n=1 Tax=unclassified Enterococcus TaxID=2608891 RepID=UPI0024768061|nr:MULTISPECIES: PduM family microcompartment protein [unclassified Enterococcus]MDH6365449.1 microcompartment protein PduM [Enterococcus sp. PFB1-1]MDH6402550.1 microcompartment protein PduM [Enterococcus sp. PF1-24]